LTNNTVSSLPGTLWVQHDNPERICDSLYLE